MRSAQKIAIIGAGSWGTALALAATRNVKENSPKSISLWTHRKSLWNSLLEKRENLDHLPGYQLPDNIFPTQNLAEALDEAQLVITAIPSHVTRQTYEQMKPYLKPQMVFLNASKGIELSTKLRMSEVISEVLSENFEPRFVSLGGPSFAQEVAKGDPTAVVAASFVPQWSEYVQSTLGSSNFRIYSSHDVIGVEIGAAIKNVIAIAAGIISGLGFGYNTIIAVITRGLAEMTRLSLKMGARSETLSGLAGVGDLFLTCTGKLSRNRYVGVELGKGCKLEEILAEMHAVAEGVKTTQAVYQLAKQYNVEMPITSAIYKILYEGNSVENATIQVLERPMGREH